MLLDDSCLLKDSPLVFSSLDLIVIVNIMQSIIIRSVFERQYSYKGYALSLHMYL